MKKIVLSFLTFFFSFCLFSQEVEFRYAGSQNYSLVERTDLRRYDNGKYTGLTSREVRSFISNSGTHGSGKLYDGDFYISQDTVHSEKIVADGIHDSIHSVFKINPDGEFFMIEDNGFPSFRSFPCFPQKKISIGESWQGKAVRSVDPLLKGIPTKLPIYVQYTYLRDEVTRGEPVYVLSAQWATRYGAGSGSRILDFGGDKELVKATGSHKATMYISKISGAAIVVRDSVDETFFYADGAEVSFKGTISLFTEYPPSIDANRLVPALQRAAFVDDDGAEELAEVLKGKNAGAIDEDAGLPSDAGNGAEVAAGSAAYDSENVDASSGFEKSGTEVSMKDNGTSSESVWESFSDEGISKEISGPAAKNSNESHVTVEKTSSGLMLRIENLHFKPDSAELLPEENSLLDKIASVLKEASGAQFLIEGHTASVGNPEGEMALSIERAHAIASSLSKRGVPSGAFICRGSGSTKPIAPNNTKEDMAKNRRVEITILQ